MKITAGFTLIELMIVVAIIGILSSIAYPSYIEHLSNGRRIIAQTQLQAFSSAMEQYYVQNNSDYRLAATDDNVPNVHTNTIVIEGTVMYNITVPSVLAASYTLKATPVANTPQAGNGYIQITSTGAKSWNSPDGLVNHW